MNHLKYSETMQLEDSLQMKGGYVLDFTNNSFEIFFRSEVSIEIVLVQREPYKLFSLITE